MKRLILLFLLLIPSVSFAWSQSINDVIPVFTSSCTYTWSTTLVDYCVYSADIKNFTDFFFYNVVMVVFGVWLFVKFIRLFYNFIFK